MDTPQSTPSPPSPPSSQEKQPKERGAKERSDQNRVKAIQTMMETSSAMGPFLVNEPPPLGWAKASYFGPLSHCVLRTAEFFRLTSHLLGKQGMSYDEIFNAAEKLLQEQLGPYDSTVITGEDSQAEKRVEQSARMLMSLRRKQPNTSQCCSRCRKIVQRRNFDAQRDVCISCLDCCAFCDTYECQFTTGLINVSSGRNAAHQVNVCPPCAELLDQPSACTRCNSPVVKPAVLHDSGNRPALICRACIFTCPGCCNTELQTGATHCHNAAKGVVPPSLGFCRSCFDHAARGLKYFSSSQELVGASSALLQEAVDAIPPGTSRSRLQKLVAVLKMNGL